LTRGDDVSEDHTPSRILQAENRKGVKKMNTRRLTWEAACALLITLLLIGCGPKNMEVTFQGNGCTVSGPDELKTGENQFVLINLSDEDNLSLLAEPLLEGHTYQDLVEWAGESGIEISESGSDWPDWVGFDNSRLVAYEKDESTGEEIYTFDLKKEGPYYITVINNSTSIFYPCAALKVVEATSE
jgi:hypothetical protein